MIHGRRGIQPTRLSKEPYSRMASKFPLVTPDFNGRWLTLKGPPNETPRD